MDELCPCSRHQMPVIVHMIKLAATAAKIDCLSILTQSNLDSSCPCSRHQLPVVVHMIKLAASAAKINCLSFFTWLYFRQVATLQQTSTACDCPHDQTRSQCSRHQRPVILHMTKLGQLASLQKAHSRWLASAQWPFLKLVAAVQHIIAGELSAALY